MTKPTKRSSSGKPSDKSKSGTADSEKSPAKEASSEKETLKLRQEAAKPGTVAAKDVGAGDGKSAAAGGDKVTPAESSVVGDSDKGRPAAKAKDRPDQDQGSARAAASDTSRPPEIAKKPESTAAKESSSQNMSGRKGGGFWPVALGGVVAAGIGAGAAIWALPHLPAGWLPEQEEAIDVAAIKAEAVTAAEEAARAAVSDADTGSAEVDLSGLQATLDEHGQRIAALEQFLSDATAGSDSTEDATDGGEASGGGAGNPSTASAAMSAGSEVAGEMKASIAQLQERLDAQAAQLEELQARPTIEPEKLTKIEDLAARVDTLRQEISTAAEETAAQLEATKAEATKLQQAASETTQRAEAVVAIGALRDALEKGVTAQEAQKTFESAGMDTPGALQKDVPSLENLQENFEAAARNALREFHASGGGQEGGNVVLDFLKAQTGARSVTPREGDDPDSVLSRAGASVEGGDIAGAVDEIAALPDPVKEAMSDWISDATAYRDAQAALSDLSTSTN